MGKKYRTTISVPNCVEIIEYTPVNSHDTPRQRAAKSKTTSEARKRKNAALSRRNLKFRLAANFHPGRDYFCTLTFAPGAEPRNRAAVEAAARRFIRRLRDIRRRRGEALIWLYTAEHRHGAGRWHIHIVLNAATLYRCDLEEIESLWGLGAVQMSRLFTGKHRKTTWGDLARYMSKERPENDPERAKVGTHTYHCSRNLRQPIVDGGWVHSSDRAEAPANAVNVEREEYQSEYTAFLFLSYEMPHDLPTFPPDN